MPNISALKKSKFLKKEDCDPAVLVTIKGCEEMNVAPEGQDEELKWCLLFEETDKPLVLNSTNGQIIATMTGKDNTDDWTGTKVVLYHDPNVSFGGKLIGGIRVRAPKAQGKPGTKPAPAKPASNEEDVPY